MKRMLALSLVMLTRPALAADSHQRPVTASSSSSSASTAPLRLEVTVTSEGFTVKKPQALKVGQPVTLVVTRTTERTCATDIVLQQFGLKKALPLNQPIEVSFVPQKAGPVRFACAMDMVSAELTVE